MGLFSRKKSSFSETNVNLGEERVSFLKPNKKELNQLKRNPRLSNTPHGKIKTVKVNPFKAFDDGFCQIYG